MANDLDGARSLSADVVVALTSNRDRFLASARRRADSDAVAEELLQDAYTKAVEHGAKLQNGEAAVAWVFRVLRNSLTDYYRRREVEGRAINTHKSEAPNRLLPELKNNSCACMHEILPTLRPGYADLLHQIDLGERDVADLAAERGITVNTTTVRLHRARQALKVQLERRCGSCSSHCRENCTCRKQPATLEYRATR